MVEHMAAVSRQGNDLRQSLAGAAVFTQHLSKVLLAMLGKSLRVFEKYFRIGQLATG